MPGDDTLHWSESFCVGCRQVTWHYDGRCSNRDFHRSSQAFSFEQPDVVDEAITGAVVAEAPEVAEQETMS